MWNGQSITFLWNFGLGLFYGSTPQSPWTGYPSGYSDQDLPYGGLAYVVTASFDLGSSPNLPSLAFDVHGRLVGTCGFNEWDANPALVVQDFLTSSQYGVGFPPASINSTTLLGGSGGASYQNYCLAAALGISPVLSNQEMASSVIARWLQLTNTAAVWSGGKLKFIPYGDAPITANGTSFAPNVTPIYNLTDDDFVHDGDKDPVEIVRSDPFTAKNWVTLEILDRSNWYDATTVQAWDQNAIELYGLHMESTITAHEVCHTYIASTMAQLILQRCLYIRNTYHFKLSFEYCLLEPMDLVTITDAGLGMSNVAVRITSIEEEDTGLLSVTAEEFPGGTATSVAYPVQGGSSRPLDHGVVPSAVNPPIIFEPPAALTNGVAEVWVALSGGIAPVYKIAEDGSTGYHFGQWTSGVSEASGSSVSFRIHVQAVERTKCWAQIFDGVSYFTAEFDLVAGTATPGTGVTAAITSAANSFWQINMSCVMGAAGAPIVLVGPETAIGTRSYTGAVGSGIYIWGGSLFGASEEATFFPSGPAGSGATVASTGVTTPQGASGGADPNWGGAFIYLSTDDATYEQIGQVHGPSRQGFLAASVAAPSEGNPDVGNTVSVNLAGSRGSLASGTIADAQNGVTLCIVDRELFAYQAATLTGESTYALTYLERGLYGSMPAAHAANAPFARLDGLIFKYPLSSTFVGVPLFLKFQSFNIFGQAVQDLSTSVTYTYTPIGSSVLGPVTQALKVGSNLEYGTTSVSVNESDDFGIASDSYLTVIDLGLASE